MLNTTTIEVSASKQSASLQVSSEVKVVSNVRALQQEEVGAQASTAEMIVAPEEVRAMVLW